MNLLPGEDGEAWERWIAPQLAQAPFEIKSAFDMLWWLNFSCKWQQVGMRCCHDGGVPLAPVFEGYGGEIGGGSRAIMVPAARKGAGAAGAGAGAEETTVSSLLCGVRHFFDDRKLELWSCVPECHARKFGDLSEWSSYKEPLKKFIFDFDGNQEYYRTKKKVPSLNHGVDEPNCAAEYVDSMLGMVVDENEMAEAAGGGTHGLATGMGEAAPTVIPRVGGGARVRILRWGATSMREGAGLAALLEPDFIAAMTGSGTGATRQVEVDPWAGVDGTSAGSGSAGTLARAYSTGVTSGGVVTAVATVVAVAATVCSAASPGLAFAFKGGAAGPVDAFDSGPGADFASDDERQRRHFNPVTAATLVGKCACLLPPDLVRGRSVLDLGACLGCVRRVG